MEIAREKYVTYATNIDQYCYTFLRLENGIPVRSRVSRTFPVAYAASKRNRRLAFPRFLRKSLNSFGLFLRWRMRAVGRRGHLLFTDRYTSTWQKCSVDSDGDDDDSTWLLRALISLQTCWYSRFPIRLSY